jgi:hypothetical protein
MQKLGFCWDIDDYLIAQAYADDILLFSDSYEHMIDLLGIVNDFNYESNIQLNPKKCEMLEIVNDFQNRLLNSRSYPRR